MAHMYIYMGILGLRALAFSYYLHLLPDPDQLTTCPIPNT